MNGGGQSRPRVMTTGEIVTLQTLRFTSVPSGQEPHTEKKTEEGGLFHAGAPVTYCQWHSCISAREGMQ